ncbi:hypothetical protein [Candidatus Formimonas warabiya]|uniref:hypothetical protein n=1 Tax=Formimonas warabiya TaxID=1761012 RepID=UPI001BE4D6D5|nr:hypothetical protein [Candidatus Formimonas warabiya]
MDEQDKGLACPRCHSSHLKTCGPSISLLAAMAKGLLEYAYQCELCGYYFKSPCPGRQ